MHEGKAKSAELIIFPDGTLYHIDLKKSDGIPKNLFLVGAAERVDKIAEKFTEITFKHRNKARPEFYIVAGRRHGVPMAAMSIGIGVDNTEIALNELHALFEYDYKNDEWSKQRPVVNIIRIGTSGGSLKEVPAGAIAVSQYGLGLDNLGVYYPVEFQMRFRFAREMQRKFRKSALLGHVNPLSYFSQADPRVAMALMEEGKALHQRWPMLVAGITTSSPGFFAPEGRSVGRIKAPFTIKEFVKDVQDFEHQGIRIVNHEMESSALFRIGHEILGYRVGTICTVVDNLSTHEVLEAKAAGQRMDTCVDIALNAMESLAS